MIKTPTVAVFYPWDNILERKSGSSRRTGEMLDVLSDNYNKVVCTSPFGLPDTNIGNVLYTGYAWPPVQANQTCDKNSFITLFYRFLFNLLMYITKNASENEKGLLWMHYMYATDPSFASHAEKIVDEADIVIVEFTFTALAVAQACNKKKKKMILTLHDLMSDHITKSKILKTVMRRIENAAMKKADFITCSTLRDADIINKRGIKSEVIPHGIDINKYKINLLHADCYSILKKAWKLTLASKKICLFIGALHWPNMEAANNIREMAISEEKNGSDDVVFIVVGDCCKPEMRDNFVSLGRIDEEALHALYNVSDLVLIPLLNGGGASIKTIEAMAYGKAILGTSVAFRGYPVTDGLNCIVCDDLDDYKNIIKIKLSNKGELKELGKNARKFAESYNSRNLYKNYIEIIAKLLAEIRHND